MNTKLIESVANAVLYEGYMLYPYRLSAIKNRQRWTFGVLYPRDYSEATKGSDAWMMQTQCLIRSEASARIFIQVRFLQAVSRQMGKLAKPLAELGERTPQLELVESLEVGNRLLQSWQETVEREVALPPIPLTALVKEPVRHTFDFSGGRELEPVKDDAESVVGFIVRTRKELTGSLEVSIEKCSDGLFRLTVVLTNRVVVENPSDTQREDALLKSLLSAHTVLGITGGAFVSLIDPPQDLEQAASECRNIGTWPVLIGEDHASDAMLSSPIILYDYPQIAPESPGDLFDGTEIDEILALRILALSDDEKREIQRTDDRAREVLERTEKLPEEHFLKLHGVLRGMNRPNSTGGDVDRGDKQ